jgi:uncharacterized protein YdcH (DUF465 family)
MPSSREILKKAGRSATESAIRAAMPELQKILETMQADIGNLDAKFVQLDEKIDERFNRILDALNQVGERIARVEGKLEAYVDLTRQQLGSTQGLIERVVRLEMSQPARRARAG